ncbi:hypothetical protein G3N95_05165 [Paraburkholderia sp. Tr-20389]|uniref:VF_A0006 family four-cysteine protein n=1 Tax=Paraburkholderia sp. Tr-20389 TaxID=2703903 RepID=UPI0019801ADA|nr:VF_A0006 family four-cysteine protein [Paraburkholderia sp. Tr-20389]MBN3752317.1 hypothetical protein [Paraburkholderia sp. Tr-20389]
MEVHLDWSPLLGMMALGGVMRNLCIVLMLASCVSTSSRADGFDGQDNNDTYRQCVAKSARSTASMLAFQVMQNACLKLYRQSSALSDAEKGYYACLLRNLLGVNNDIHAQMAAKACGEPR